MQQLLEGVGSGNGSSGVPPVVGGKHQHSLDDESLASSKNAKMKSNDDTATFAQLSSSIEKHSNSLISAAKIAAAEQEKNRTQTRVSEINSRINSLRDSKREMTLRLTTPDVMKNQFAIDAILNEIKGIEEEIAVHTEELNGILATPTKSNCSPN